MRTPARLISIALLSLGLGLMAGCATTENTATPTANDATAAAQQAIDAAKAANKQAAAVGYEWRDTGKIIKKAEAALASGNTDEATKLANKAEKQAQDAVKQQAAAHKKYLDSLSPADRAGTAGTLSQGSKGAMAGKVSSYSVNRGDSLWKISGKDQVYANPYEWPLIYKTNRSKIKDADLIYPGQVFNIDQNASPAEVSAAIHHAKTRGAWSIGDVEQSDLNYLKK